MLADEIGKLERDAKEFQDVFFRCLDEKPIVLGVLREDGYAVCQSDHGAGGCDSAGCDGRKQENVYEEILKGLQTTGLMLRCKGGRKSLILLFVRGYMHVPPILCI